MTDAVVLMAYGSPSSPDDIRPYLEAHSGSDVVLADDHPPPELSAIPKTDPMFYNVGRNEMCPCGSGLKFKKCHGR